MSKTSVAQLRSIPASISHEVVHVTPEMAEKMLTKNDHNRNIRQAKVDQFARDMIAGRWVLNGEAVQIAVDGTVLNGQHRLKAIVRSGKTIPLLIVKGLPIEAQETIDTGAKRSLGDSLALRGEANPTLLAAITRRAAMWDAGARTNIGKIVPSEQECRSYLANQPLLRLATDVAARSRKYINCPGSVFGLAFYLCARQDVIEAKAFFIDELTEGIGVDYRSPAWALRKRLASETERRGRVAETDLLGYLLRAWNARCRGESLTLLKSPQGGWTASNIPAPEKPRVRSA